MRTPRTVIRVNGHLVTISDGVQDIEWTAETEKEARLLALNFRTAIEAFSTQESVEIEWC